MRRHPDLLDHVTPTQFMAAQYVPGDVRDFILKHIASVAQIEALLLIWSSPEERWGLPEIAARIYTSETETAKALDGLCCRRVAGLQEWRLSVERVNRKRRNDSKTSGSVRPPSHPGDGYHSQQIPEYFLNGRDVSAPERTDEVPVIACSACIQDGACACASRRVLHGLVGLGALLLAALFVAQPILCPKALFLRTADDGPVLHDLCQRRLMFGWQGLEGAGRAAESTAEEELRANE